MNGAVLEEENKANIENWVWVTVAGGLEKRGSKRVPAPVEGC